MSLSPTMIIKYLSRTFNNKVSDVILIIGIFIKIKRNDFSSLGLFYSTPGI